MKVRQDGIDINMSKRKKHIGGRFSTMTSCISTTMVLILMGIVVFFVLFANSFSRNVRETMPVAVVVNDSISQHQLYLLQQYLREQPYTLRTNFVSKERGSMEVSEAMEDTPEAFLNYNPIPAEFDVYLKAEYANMDSLRHFVPILRQRYDVSDVVYPIDEMRSLDQTIPTVTIVLLVLAILLAFVSFALINNTIRMSIYACRFSIHTMKLVGARWSFIRRPFMWQALGIGLISAVIASGLIGFGIYLLWEQNLYVGNLITPVIVGATLGTIFVCGLLMTLACAYVSVNRYLRMSEGQMYLK